MLDHRANIQVCIMSASKKLKFNSIFRILNTVCINVWFCIRSICIGGNWLYIGILVYSICSKFVCSIIYVVEHVPWNRRELWRLNLCVYDVCIHSKPFQILACTHQFHSIPKLQCWIILKHKKVKDDHFKTDLYF